MTKNAYRYGINFNIHRKNCDRFNLEIFEDACMAVQNL